MSDASAVGKVAVKVIVGQGVNVFVGGAGIVDVGVELDIDVCVTLGIGLFVTVADPTSGICEGWVTCGVSDTDFIKIHSLNVHTRTARTIENNRTPKQDKTRYLRLVGEGWRISLTPFLID